MISKSLSVGQSIEFLWNILLLQYLPLHKDACNMFAQGMGVIFLLAQIIICI